MIFKFLYKFKGKLFEETFNGSKDLIGATVRFFKNDEGFTLNILPVEEIEIVELSVKFNNSFSKNDILFLNGYQSWTDSHEQSIESKMSGLRRIPRFIQNKYNIRPYGDYDFTEYSGKKGDLHGFTYSYILNNGQYKLLGSLSESFAFTIITYNTKKGFIKLEKDCKGLKTNKDFVAFDIAMLDGSEDYVFDRYFELMNIKKPTVNSITGYTSWYNYYQNINEDTLIKDLNAITGCNIKTDVFQIDDGYQTKVGDWLSVDLNKFPNGMKYMAECIASKNLIPGIWLAPFSCEFSSNIVKMHRDWLLKDKNGKLAIGGGNWGGFYVLDFYNTQVQNYIKECFNVIINEWGFKLLKLDFLYSVCIAPDNHKTRGEIMCEVMDFIRNNTKGAQLLGCGVPLGPAFGKVDYCRIGCDVGLDYDDKWFMRLMHRERVSTRNAMMNAVGRRQLSKRAFLNDPDVFLLRNDNIYLNENQKYKLAKINSLTGDVLFTSDNVSNYSSNQLSVFAEIVNSSKEKIYVKPFKDGLIVKYKTKIFKI